MTPFFNPEKRTCMVTLRGKNGFERRPAFFHLFTTIAYPVDPSPLKGGHRGGQVSEPVAIVEYGDGTIDKVPPTYVRFLDTKEQMEQYAWEEKET